jgi:transcriptional regulator with XRE-family HTH domain
MTNVMTLGERLKQSREALGLSQAELARKAGMTQGSIGNLETGTRKSAKNILVIAQALGVDAMWLQYGAAQYKPPQAEEKPVSYMPGLHPWPFAGVHESEWARLSRHQKSQVEAFIRGMLASEALQETEILSAAA